MTSLQAIAGRDFTVPTWSLSNEASIDEHAANRCDNWDSVVVHSTGLGALCLAGRLARSSRFRGRVRIVGAPVEESPRLRAGVTLRARTLDAFAAAMGVDNASLLERIYGPEPRQAETHRQFGAVATGRPETGFRIGKVRAFMDRSRPRRDRSPEPVLAYGVRNSRLRAVLQELALDSGATLDPVPATTLAGLLEHADGERPLLVNGTPKPLDDAPLLRPPPSPREAVGAAQLTFQATRLEQRGVLSRHDAIACFVLRDGALDMGVYYPFQDALTPDADYYGIFYRVEPFDRARLQRQELLETLEATVVGVGDALGLEPVARDATLGTAIVPVSPWKGVVNCQDAVLDLSRVAGAGAPIITGDGMTRSAIAGLVGAESLIAGRDPVPEIDRALRRYRQLNRELWMIMTRVARPAHWLLRHAPGLALLRQSRSYHHDMWAGVLA